MGDLPVSSGDHPVNILGHPVNSGDHAVSSGEQMDFGPGDHGGDHPVNTGDHSVNTGEQGQHNIALCLAKATMVQLAEEIATRIRDNDEYKSAMDGIRI